MAKITLKCTVPSCRARYDAAAKFAVLRLDRPKKTVFEVRCPGCDDRTAWVKDRAGVPGPVRLALRKLGAYLEKAAARAATA